MASDETIRETILSRMVAGYAQPKHVPDPAAKLQDYLLVLRQFDPEALRDGWAIVVAAHRFSAWPEPGAIVSACREALDRRHAARRVDSPPPLPPGSSHEAVADREMLTVLGAEARRDGWSRELHRALCDHGDLSRVDVARMRMVAEKIRAQRATFEADAAAGKLTAIGHMLWSIATTKARLEVEHASRWDVAA